MRRQSLSPAPPSPVLTRTNTQYFTTMPLQTQTPFYSNKMQFLQPAPSPNYVPVQYVDNRSQDRSRERSRHQPQPQSYVQLVTSRRLSEEKENKPVFGTTSKSDSVPTQYQNYFLQLLDTAKEDWKQQAIDEFKLLNTNLHSQFQEQINIIQDQQRMIMENEMIQKILKKELTYQTIIQQRTDIIGKVLSLEEQIDKLRDDVFTNSFSVDKCKEYISSELNLKNICDRISSQVFESLKQPYQQMFARHEVELEKYKYNQKDQIIQLKEQISDLKYSFMKQSMSKSQQQQAHQNSDDYDYDYKPSQLQQDPYDLYIKKYENFNKQVSDYLQTRKLPDQLIQPNRSLGNDLFYNSHQTPRSVRNSDRSAQDTCSNSFTRTPKSDTSDSPIRGLLNERSSPQQQSLEQLKEDSLRLRSEYKCRMSAITEKEVEEDEVVYDKQLI